MMLGYGFLRGSSKIKFYFIHKTRCQDYQSINEIREKQQEIKSMKVGMSSLMLLKTFVHTLRMGYGG
nr:MAG TPA: hypothetical protein [Caudoviricetes sp.]